MNQQIEYSSSNPAVASVNADGLVTAVSPGNATITTKAETLPGSGTYVSSTCNVTCVKSKVAPKKASNPMTAKAKKIKAKRGKKSSFAAKKAFTIKNAKGTLSFKVVKYDKKAKKKIKVSVKGKVTVKKGLKKGTYKLKASIADSGNASFLPATKVVTLKVKVR